MLNIRNWILIPFGVVLSSLIVSPSAFAQDDSETEESQDSQVEENVISVSKQNSCNLLLKNGGELKINQKIMLSHPSSLTGFAIVRKVNPNGLAQAILSKKLCTKNFIGAKATIMTSDGSNLKGNSASVGGKSLPKEVEPDSSAHDRIRNKSVLRVGFGWMFIPGYTIAGGYNFSHKVTVEGTFDSASLNLLNIYKYDRLRVGALGHYFTANSFHLTGGFVFEKFTSGTIGGAVNESGITLVDNAFTADISQMQIQIGLGNRWNIGRFVIGSEWVGYSRPLFNLSETFNRIEAYSDIDFESAKIRNKEFASTASFRLLNSYIGFSF